MRLFSGLLLSCAGLLLAFSLTGCGPTVTGCEATDNGGVELPDPSFEESPTLWTLAPNATIDPEHAVCEGSNSLRVQLDSGSGPAEATRSANFTGTTPGRDYEVRFQFRYENGKAAALRATIGGYAQVIKFDGMDKTFKPVSFTVAFGEEPAWVEIRPEREGDPSQFQGSEFDNNVIWIDDFTIEDLGPSAD